jgi:glycerol-3-phosphate dehydrogenase subunit C
MTGEGSLGAPTREIIKWQDPAFADPAKLDKEMRRVFDICHGCRRCFNLCDSFPRLFDMIDATSTGELDEVPSSDFAKVAEACTLCDMCFMTKCPYVPPHEFNLDFPHLMLRRRAIEQKTGQVPFAAKQLTETDRNGKLAGAVAPLANWASNRKNGLTRPVLEAAADVHRDAELPKFYGKTFVARAKSDKPARDTAAPASARKVAIFATCFVNYNNPTIGEAALGVLAKNGVETEVVYPGCCGMPQFENADLARVAETAKRIAGEFKSWIDKGYDVIALVPSCALMMKFEWPLLLPDDEDVKRLSKSTWDISEYVIDISKKEGLAAGIAPVDGGVTLHFACHSRAQNMGNKAAEMLRLIPGADVNVIERCSGHGGSWGIRKENFEVALKVGKPVARAAADQGKAYIASECPLAGKHVLQGAQKIAGEGLKVEHASHPIEIFARAYGLK